MEEPGRPRDLIPDRPSRGLSQAHPEDLTAENAARSLGSHRKAEQKPSRRGEEGDPVTRRGGVMETLSYVVVVAVIIGFQILSGVDEGELSLFDDPRVTAIIIDDQITGKERTVSGNRLAMPQCPGGPPALTVTGYEQNGFSLGSIEIHTATEDGGWTFRASGWLAGGAEVRVQARIECQAAPSDAGNGSNKQ